jgi:hypothetical protein
LEIYQQEPDFANVCAKIYKKNV